MARRDAAVWAIGEVVRLWRTNPEPARVVFNVNVPNLPVSRLSGTLITYPTTDSCLTKYRFSPDPHAENTVAATRDDGDGLTPEPWTDA